MVTEDIRSDVKQILVTHLKIAIGQFDWEKPLDELQGNFKILGYLVYLEQLLNKKFDFQIPVLENINSAIHSPNDIALLIQNEIKNNKFLKSN